MEFTTDEAFQIFLIEKLGNTLDEYLKSRSMLDHENVLNVTKCFFFTAIAKSVCSEKLPEQLNLLNLYEQEVKKDFENVRKEICAGTFDQFRKEKK